MNWNVRRANSRSFAWQVILNDDPDLIAIQEVSAIPSFITDAYRVCQTNAIKKTGEKQAFSTAILTKREIENTFELKSAFEWVNKELERLSGNLVTCQIKAQGRLPINVVSVHSPAWPIDRDRLCNLDVTAVKLKNNREMWVTKLLWSALANGTVKQVTGWWRGSIL